jgi:hypothetical protein
MIFLDVSLFLIIIRSIFTKEFYAKLQILDFRYISNFSCNNSLATLIQKDFKEILLYLN